MTEGKAPKTESFSQVGPVYFRNPRQNLLIMFVVKIASFLFTLPYRVFLGNRVQFGRNFITNWKLKIIGPGKVVFGDNIFAWCNADPNVFRTFNRDTIIKIGDNCRLNGIGCEAKREITLGDNCIAGTVQIVDTDFHSTSPDRMTNPYAQIKTEPVLIGNNVWICGKSAILKGVTVGNNSIIGFGSIVTHDVPPDTLVAGNPAQVIKELPSARPQIKN